MADARGARWVRLMVAGCGVAVVAAGTYLLVDPSSRAAAAEGLRTARVTTGSVTQSVDLSGSVQRVDQVSTAFRTPGTVTSVKVEVGDIVTAGQVLATTDPAPLSRAVTVAQADLVAAQAALDAGQSGTGTTTQTSAPSPSPTSTPTATTGGSGAGPGSGGRAGGPGQGGGGIDTGALSAATSMTEKLIAQARTACQPVLGDAGGAGRPGGPTASGPSPMSSATSSATPSPSATTASPSPTATSTPTSSPTATPSPSATPAPTASSSPSPTATATSSPTPTSSPSPTATASPSPSPTSSPTPTSTGPTAAEVSACVGALTQALGATDRAGGTLTRLADVLDAAATALQQQQSTANLQGTTSNGATTMSMSGGSVGGQGVGSTATREVEVLKATQALATAQQDLDGATLKAPISGTVASIGFAVGEVASTSTPIVIVGPGAAVVTVEIPLAQLGMVRVAQPVVVTPAGTTDELAGLVESIGVLPTSTTSSTPTYPVAVTVSDAPVTLATGSRASAGITLSEVENVLTVPVSAVSGVTAGQGQVQVADGDTVSTVRVTVGAVGQGRAAVDSGLTLGQTVVLADPSQALPANGTRGRGGFGGGFAPGGLGGPGGSRRPG